MILLPGKVFGDLTLIKLKLPVLNGHYEWWCNCRCGKQKDIREMHLLSGKSTSCGHCNYNISHPLAHKSWDSMNQRCNNPNAPDYPRYGGRGISVCAEWNRFINFLDDMGDPPTDLLTGQRHTLERKDVNGNYIKENCRWASKQDQNYNKTNSLHPAIAIMRIKTDYYRKKKP